MPNEENPCDTSTYRLSPAFNTRTLGVEVTFVTIENILSSIHVSITNDEEPSYQDEQPPIQFELLWTCLDKNNKKKEKYFKSFEIDRCENKFSTDLAFPEEFLEHAVKENFSSVNLPSALSTSEQEQPSSLDVISLISKKKPSEEFSQLLADIESGLDLHPPELCEEGINGTYFLKDTKNKFAAIFKPDIEQGNSKDNPKYQEGEEEIIPLLPTEMTIREVAAYEIDTKKFFGVPETALVQLTHSSLDKEGKSLTKTGSLQRFIQSDGAAWDINPRLFPKKEVHKIGILDVILMNCDRHEGNILFQKIEDGPDETYKLIPIDHGYCLASYDKVWFDWLNWPQAALPFDEETKQFIESIDIEEYASILRNLEIREECIDIMKVSTTLLKIGSQKGLTLKDIGNIICRTGDMRNPSLLEQLIETNSASGSDRNDLTKCLCEMVEKQLHATSD